MTLPIGNQRQLDRTNYSHYRDILNTKKPRSVWDVMFQVNRTECQHEHFDKNNQCDNCGYECTEHDYGKNGECRVCGHECEHLDHDGHSCLECGLECHEFIDFESAYEGDR